MAPRQLKPVSPPLAVFDHMVAQHSQTLVLKEGFLDFDIKGLDGKRWLHVDGKMVSARGRKKVKDASNKPLFDIVKRHFTWHTTFSLQDANKKELVQVKSKFAFVGSKAEATFTTTRGKAVTLLMKGNWLDSAEIIDQANGAVVAHIDRKLFNAREAVTGKQTYHVTVAQGVDMALIAAMCICLDEKQNMKKNQGVCTVM